jgi:formamidopyrimidine-DNA glycosylase
MPELPEMENYKQLLVPLVLNKPIASITITREKSINLAPESFRQQLIHHAIVSIERRAKHLLFEIDSGSVLLLHLMLGGSMYYGKEEPDRTSQIVLDFGEKRLYFIGLRLGYLHLHSRSEINRLMRKLGPEPLESKFTLPEYLKVMKGRSTNLKVTLVDQSIISGIGNCYADEICFAAGLLPTRRINALQDNEHKRLYRAMQSVLKEAVRYGGYMDTPLYAGDKLTGQFDARCKVYDREDEPCARCGYPIVKDQVSAKKCFYCRHCQQ